jgi:hypothetical protein
MLYAGCGNSGTDESSEARSETDVSDTIAEQSSPDGKTFSLENARLLSGEPLDAELDLGNGLVVLDVRCLDGECTRAVIGGRRDTSTKLWLVKSPNGERFTITDEVDLGVLATSRLLGADHYYSVDALNGRDTCTKEYAGLTSLEPDGTSSTLKTWDVQGDRLVELPASKYRLADECGA